MGPQREWFDKDYYEVLGVPKSATHKDITKRYRKLARQLHPDANPDDPSAEERFKGVSAAYDVLGDEAKRKEYDEARLLASRGFGAGGRPGPGGGPGGFTFTSDDVGGLFGNLFRGGGPGGPPPRAAPGRGSDLEAELHISFRDAVHGVTTSVNLTSEVVCHTCQGSGARPGTSPQICPSCRGRGVIDDDQGLFSFSHPCSTCLGRGSVVTDPCTACGGAGAVVKPRDVKVRIPAGVGDGQRIRVKGRGSAGRRGGPPGDLHVRVHVAADPVFGRKGRDLTIAVPITFAEAVLGTGVSVPTLDDGPVTVRIPPGTPTGQTFRVKDRGIATRKGTGNLLVTVEVAVPSDPSPEERELVERLAELDVPSPRAHLGGGT